MVRTRKGPHFSLGGSSIPTGLDHSAQHRPDTEGTTVGRLFVSVCEYPLINPDGIGSFSPGLARFREGLPWVTAFKLHNPERVEYQEPTKRIQPFQGCGFIDMPPPRVARCSQPWAE